MNKNHEEILKQHLKPQYSKVYNKNVEGGLEKVVWYSSLHPVNITEYHNRFYEVKSSLYSVSFIIIDNHLHIILLPSDTKDESMMIRSTIQSLIDRKQTTDTFTVVTSNVFITTCINEDINIEDIILNRKEGTICLEKMIY